MALGIFKKRKRADKCWVISNLDRAELAHYFLPRGKSIREFSKYLVHKHDLIGFIVYVQSYM